MRNFLLILLGLLIGGSGGIADGDQAGLRTSAHQAMDAGNFKNAAETYQKLALDPADDPAQVGDDMDQALACLDRLGRTDEGDDFREAVIAAHKDNWRLLQSAAMSYNRAMHFGNIVAGKFHRGYARRGGARMVSTLERDRGRALQLLAQALPLAADKAAGDQKASFYFNFSDVILDGEQGREAWRLQSLSDLATLPDEEEGYRYYGSYGRQDHGAPVDEKGNPIFYAVPASFGAAASDGERWRWLLRQAEMVSPANADKARFRLASFLREQFDVQTMAYYGLFGRSGDTKNETGPFAVRGLAEDETIARLATGVKRFKLPDEFNFIHLLQGVADSKENPLEAQPLEFLARIFTDREQYDKAAGYWKRAITAFGAGDHQSRQKALDQIVGSWGQFGTIAPEPAGKPASLEFRFRNGRGVHFEASEIKIANLLNDVKAYLKSNPGQIDWQKFRIDDIGYRLVVENQKQYVGDSVANWDLKLEPRDGHLDRELTVTTPLKSPGAYLLKAQMENGNLSQIVVWVADTVLVKKPMDSGASYYFAADAVTGQPVSGANLDFFGYQQQWLQNQKFRVNTLQYSETSDEEGQVKFGKRDAGNAYSWLVTATTKEGRLAYLGFTGLWSGPYTEGSYDEMKIFTITDRPVYRPKQSVKFKLWVNQARYDQEGHSPYAGRSFTLEIHNPRGDKVWEKAFTADPYGGFDGEWPLPEDATLGVYSMFLKDLGGTGSFRVEEYKKPEFQVKIDAPTEPIKLGDKIVATVRANYYFGAPVTSAKVHYKVLRSSYEANWYPIDRWDWLYQPGYWWFAGNYDWYPGWQRWGMRRAHPIWWWGRQNEQPEVVLENDAPIGADGTLKIEIDTALAKAIHGDQDHKYSIAADVTDQSRRTITGTGDVIVAREPFKVYAWVGRGYYRAGDVVQASFLAQTLQDKPVPGKGRLTLFRVSYDSAGTPNESPVQKWNLDTGADGRANVQVKAARPGQYRLSYTVTDAKGAAEEGGYLFSVRGENFNGREFRFNDVELVTDQREYHVGDTVRLAVNTNLPDSTVLLFVRPVNGVYLAPKVLHLKGKSTVQEIGVIKQDMPNFFVEALTVANGAVYSDVREVAVPPEKRVLTVDVTPNSTTYKPGEKAHLQIKVTDASGKPFAGSSVISLYDKSLDYITGGSNVPEIKSFFWKWRRSHYPQTESSVERFSNSIAIPGTDQMQTLGVFGDLAIYETQHGVKGEGRRASAALGELPVLRAGAGGGFGGGGGFGAMGNDASVDSLALGAAAAPAAPRGALAIDGVMDRTKRSDKAAAGEPGEQAPLVEPTLRTNFADTALWVSNLTTGADGLAAVDLTMPENLTTWKAQVWSIGDGACVGEGSVEVTTSKNVIVRLQAPRFFVQKDEVVLSADVHNYLKTAKRVQVVFTLDGPALAPAGQDPASNGATQWLEVKPNSDTRADFRVRVQTPGEAVVRVSAKTNEESDAMELKFPVYIHGMLKTTSFTGSIRDTARAASITVHVPAERLPDQSRLEIRYSPSLATAMVDALPYMVDYPYACTEQTLNRFLPTVITQKVLLDLKLDLKDIEKKRTNLNAQEIGDDAARAADWKRNNPPNPGEERNPVFDTSKVAAMVKDGIAALQAMQVTDGGWGWFGGYGEQSYPHTTALVVHGLQEAKSSGADVPPEMIDRGTQWLKNYAEEQVKLLRNFATKTEPWKEKPDNIDALVEMVLADAGAPNTALQEFLYRDRTSLSVYGLTLLALAVHKIGATDQLAMLQENLSQYLVQDEENDTGYLKVPADGAWWCWYGSDIEASAFYLKLLAATDPKGKVASRLAKYLINNRRHATYWNSTRDTAFCIEAMADFIRGSGEASPDMTVRILVDGKKLKDVSIKPDNLFSYDNKLVLTGNDVTTGDHTIDVERDGTGPLYFNAYLTNFTLEDPIRKTGLEIKVDRKFYRLVRVDKKIQAEGSRGQAVDQKVEKYDRIPIASGDSLKSGDLVEVELEIDSKNDYEYILFEDMKAAGFEPVEVRSGYNGNDLGAYMEVRDNRVCFFVRELPRGKRSVSYRLRAEIPGKFSALPTRASAMYAPELKANSDEMKVEVRD